MPHCYTVLLSILGVMSMLFGWNSWLNYLEPSTLESKNITNSGNASRKMADTDTLVTIAPISANDYDDENNFDSYSTAPNSSASDLYLAIENAVDLSKLEYVGKNLTHIKPDAFLKMKNLRVLILRSNPLDIDPQQVWIHHSGIVVLDIADSDLPVFDPIVFKGLQRLELLIMSGNPGCDGTSEKALLAGVHFNVLC